MYFLNINKPKGLSSFDVVRYLRKKLGIKQIGHSGTLDPLASGVLQIAVGKATKLLDYLESDKTYIAQIQFGYTTNTYDSEGEKKFIAEPNFSKNKLLDVLNGFIGISQQIPPVYSAIKINGKKLCDLARAGSEDIEIKPREIEIYSIDLLQFDNNSATIKVSCKKGTYIRSLVNDIGFKLGCGAYMTELERILAGNFDINNSDKLESDTYNQISPLKALSLPIYEINEKIYSKVKNGNSFVINEKISTDILLLTKDNKLVSIATLSDNLVKPKKVF